MKDFNVLVIEMLKIQNNTVPADAK
jgi:hypothetical protein